MTDPRRLLLIDLLNEAASYALRNQRHGMYDEFGTGKEDAIGWFTEELEDRLKEYPE